MPRRRPAWRLPNKITFDEWVNHVFDHPVLDPPWYWSERNQEHYQYWNSQANPTRTLSYLTQLFGNSSFLIERFTRAQIDQGLTYLVNPDFSAHMVVLRDVKLPWELRRACLLAMLPLYTDLFAPVYGDDHENNHELIAFWQRFRAGESLEPIPGKQEPMYAVHMWWDDMPIRGGPVHPDQERFDDTALYILSEVLKMKEESCVESALHGLGHWAFHVPDRTTPIIEEFLRRTDVGEDLRYYAERAMTGEIL